jgi:hypothetical protein
MSGQWKFRVRGTFVKNGEPLSACEAIVESGERSESSPFRFRGVGPVAKADAAGQFQSWYVTEGSSQPIAKPSTVSVYVRVEKGAWEPIIVNIAPDRAESISGTEMRLDLGSVVIPSAISPYAQDA